MSFHSAATKLAAACFAAVFFYAASQYPFKATWIFVVLLIYISVMVWHHQLWLFVLPALIPALDLAPWTGWFFVEEIDLLLLVTASFGYWHLGRDKLYARLSGFAIVCVSMLSLVYLLGTYRGFTNFTALGGNRLNDYLSHYNSLRVGKPWLWALILLPLLTRAVGANLVNVRARFIPGILTGLAFVSVALIVERLTFPGFFNFSSDYRTSAPFSAMHTGGAALDGFLALSFPLIAVPLLTRQHHLYTVASLILLALSAYGGLTTFSRGLYLAYTTSIVIVAPLLVTSPLSKNKFNWSYVGIAALLFIIVIYALTQMFVSAGYRGLMAAIILLISAWMMPATPIANLKFLINIAFAISLEGIIFIALPLSNEVSRGMFKPSYLLFSLSVMAFFGLAWLQRHALLLVEGWINPLLIALTCISINMLWIGYHWAGEKALGPSIGIIAITLLLVGMNVATWNFFHQSNLNKIFYTSSFIIAMVAIPIVSSYSVSERFSHTKVDFQYRMRHWSQTLDMMDRELAAKFFGMGLGVFPRIYLWRNALHESTDSLHYIKEDSNRYIRLTGPIYSNGIGELLRLLQRISLRENTDYTLTIDIRNVAGKAPFNFGIAICERQLLYHKNCIATQPATIAHDSLWHHYKVAFNSQKLGVTSWSWRAPIQIEFAIEGVNASLDIDNISLRDNSGKEFIRNGSFNDGSDYWFFSSDHHHLPWHIKNFTFNLYFELGWIGVIALYSLLLHVIIRLIYFARDGQILSIALLAALGGFLVVGLADSLLDVPRLGLLFFLILISCALQPMIVESIVIVRSDIFHKNNHA